MKIAVATIDGVSLSQHFGRSAGFVVFELEGTTIKNRELRTNDRTPHAQGLCNHDGQHQHQGHSHAGILELLEDCEIVLCGGMGAGAAQALIQHGIQPIMLPAPCSADEAVSQYSNGKLRPAQSGFCACKH
jgi:predicted Fe-Mo cluster-binding NifX family protein